METEWSTYTYFQNDILRIQALVTSGHTHKLLPKKIIGNQIRQPAA